MSIAVIFNDKKQGIILMFLVPEPTKDEDFWLNECHSHMVGDTLDEEPEVWLTKWLHGRKPTYEADHVVKVDLAEPTRLIFTGRMP
jgi:hypothetical protein